MIIHVTEKKHKRFATEWANLLRKNERQDNYSDLNAKYKEVKVQDDFQFSQSPFPGLCLYLHPRPNGCKYSTRKMVTQCGYCLIYCDTSRLFTSICVRLREILYIITVNKISPPIGSDCIAILWQFHIYVAHSTYYKMLLEKSICTTCPGVSHPLQWNHFKQQTLFDGGAV